MYKNWKNIDFLCRRDIIHNVNIKFIKYKIFIQEDFTMMEVTFLRLNWVKGRRLSKSDICNGIIPVNAVETEDGTGYLIPANLYLTVRASNGSVYNWDIYEFVQNIMEWQRLSERRFAALQEAFRRQRTLKLDEDIPTWSYYSLVGLKEIVESCK